MKRGVGLLSGRRRALPVAAALALVAAVLSTTAAGNVGAVGAPASDFDGDGRGDLVLGVAGEDLDGKADAGVVTIVHGDASGVSLRDSMSVSQRGRVAGRAEAGDQFGRAFDSGDIDGDGYSDLVVGAPNEAIGSVQAAGGITVLYGSASGLRRTGTRAFSQAGAVAGPVETGDRFGSAVALGDFDGDGHDDVAVGVPGEDVGSVINAGSVNVLYGSASGLVTAGNQSFSQTGEVAGSPEPHDRFGAALAVGDFDGDGRDDLAVGVPGEDVGSRSDAGSVTILYGSRSGLSPARSEAFSQSGSVKGSPEGNDRFGFALAAGDFDGDGRDDLAVGVPGEDVGSKVDGGSVNVLYGGANGLRKAGNQTWSQNGAVNGVVERGDRFGSSLAAGNFDGDRRDDLAIGVPGEDVGSNKNAGSVNVLYGARDGLTSAGDYSFGQQGSISGSAEPHDLLGSSLQAVDLDGDGFDDLIAGAPGEDVGSATDAGVANIVYGSSSGLSSSGNESIGQAGKVAGAPEAGDALGLPRYESWLDRVNLYRSQAGLDPVSERDSLSADAELHSRYMVLNGTVTHDEIPGRAGYTAAGDASGSRSNVYGTTLWSMTDLAAVDGWVTGPFHAVGFLTPTLVEVGYGAYRDAGAGNIRMAATLDVWGAPRDWDRSAGTAYTWPGEGSVVPVRAHINEWPSPTTHCPDHRGLPMLAFFEQPVDVGEVTFTTGGAPLAHCVFDGTDYSNPDANAQSLGRSILRSANAVVVMPRNGLWPGEEYCFTVESRGVEVSSCFTVDANA